MTRSKKAAQEKAAQEKAGPDNTAGDAIPAELAALSYEEAREQLLDVVRALETGGVPLEETLALWERGEALAEVCQQRLDGARARLESKL